MPTVVITHSPPLGTNTCPNFRGGCSEGCMHSATVSAKAQSFQMSDFHGTEKPYSTPHWNYLVPWYYQKLVKQGKPKGW